MRELLDVDVFELGPVTVPADPDTSISARSGPHGIDPVTYYRSLPDVVDADELERAKLQLRFVQLL